MLKRRFIIEKGSRTGVHYIWNTLTHDVAQVMLQSLGGIRVKYKEYICDNNHFYFKGLSPEQVDDIKRLLDEVSLR